jgi:CubicO group peptidase (beta-lactamase class C family)
MASSISRRLSRGIAAAALLLSTTAIAAAAPPADIDAYVKQAMDTFGAPGLSLAIVENGKAVVTKGYGIRKLGTDLKVDEHTAFPIGSESKAFTAAALAILVDQGKLKWDDRVVDKLPGFQMYDPYATAHMTVIELLTHRSGLSLGEGDLLIVPDTNRDRADVVHALRFLKPATGFREKFAYDNILYIVAGALVQTVSGKAWEEFVTDNIFKPAGMADAHPTYDPKFPNGVALHARTSGQFRGLGPEQVLEKGLEMRVTAPAGGVNASADDMARWMNLQLAHGVLPDGKRLFSEEAHATMWRPVVVVPSSENPSVLKAMAPDMQDYALGWFVESYRGHIVIEHSGAVLGALAMMYLIPDKNVGISVTINSEDTWARRAVIFHLLDHYLDLPPTDWIATDTKIRDDLNAATAAVLAKLPKPVEGTGKASSFPAAAYAGVYADPWYGTMTVHDRGAGKLWITFDRTPGMEGPLDPVGGNTFRARWTDHVIEDAFVDFAVTKGKVGGAAMKAVSPAADFSWDFQDLHFTRR